MHVTIEFAMPTPVERGVLWQRMLPPGVVPDLDVLARLPMTGSDIRTTVATALVIAASLEQQPSMNHLIWAASRELSKAGRTALGDDLGGWQHVAYAQHRGEPLAFLAALDQSAAPAQQVDDPGD
jgi:hypothetical protein